MQSQRFCNLLANTQDRVERSHGFLENHGDFFCPQIAHGLRIRLHQVLLFKPYLTLGNASGWHCQKFHDGHGRDAFSAA